MARAKWCGEEVYEVARQFKDRCLLHDQSLFHGGATIWTPENVEAVAARVGVEDLGSGSFIEKLEGQLTGLEPEQVLLGAELLLILLLPELDTGGAKKREHLDRILAGVPAPPAVPDLVRRAVDAGGVANFAAAKAYRDAGLRFLARLFTRVKAPDHGERAALLGDPASLWRLVEEVRTSTDAMQANAFLHLMFPESFEYMVSEGHRQKLIAAFERAPGVREAVSTDDKIARIRELAAVGGDPDLDLYQDPFQRIWKEAEPPRWRELVQWAGRVYAWPRFDEWERTYKLRAVEAVAAARAALVADDPGWTAALRRAFTQRDNNLVDWRIYGPFLEWVDANRDEAARLLRIIWTPADDSGLHDFLRELPRAALSGQGTRASVASFLLFGIDPHRFPFYKPGVHGGFKKLLALEGVAPFEVDPEAVYRPDELAAGLGLDPRRVREFLREAYPRAADETGTAWFVGAEQAERVLERFRDEIDTASAAALYEEWTKLMEELRLRMLAAGTPIRDLLDAQGVAWFLVKLEAPEDWDAADRAAYEAFRRLQGGAAPPGAPPAATQAGVPDQVQLPAVSDALVKSLHLPKSWLEGLLGMLAEKKQVILFGPPGTGKTYVAKALGQHFADHGGSYRLVQFHPSYTYEDFFEGYRPKPSDSGALSFELVKGTLRAMAALAAEDRGIPHLLVIDEINRGNIAKIFGELYFLLEYRDEAIRLQYSRDEEFRLPENLFIVGTMNTADRSIALVDSALRRRFYFLGLIPTREPVNRVLAEWLAARGHPPDAALLLAELNRAIDDEEFAVGPSYFMPKGGSVPDLERIWEHAIMPLLEERYYGTGRDVRADFGLKAIERLVAAAADAPAGDDDDPA